MHLSDPAISNIANDDVIHAKRKWGEVGKRKKERKERERGREGWKGLDYYFETC